MTRRFGVVDLKSAGVGVGFVVFVDTRTADVGGYLDIVAAVAKSTVDCSHLFIVLHRLDNLYRSGCIGDAKVWLGAVLALNPLLCIEDGRLTLAQ